MRGLCKLVWLAVPVMALAVSGAGSAANDHANARAVCPAAFAAANCHAFVVTDANGNPKASALPSGLGTADFASAYKLPTTTAGSGKTVAIVDAFDDPTAESDLAVYRSTYGLPACTTANGCFRKVDQRGGTSYPRKDAGWALEISLDLDTVSAICPNCHILLVEADSNSFANLSAAVDRAALMGANAISNSYGGSEYSAEVTDQSHYNHPGIAVTVSSGDSGFGVEFPAASQYVTAVGGTTLRRDASARGWSETTWSGSGSGCSAFVSKPSWQTDTGCARRTVADVSADADPNSGAAVYDTTRYQGRSGWFVVGGTSLSAPLIAGVYALAGNTASITYGSYPYSHTTSLFDVTAGSNGACGGSYLCTAKTGYDGPTGLGTPNGTGGF
jgi:subtilase family serine protease